MTRAASTMLKLAAVASVAAWVEEHVPVAWRAAAVDGPAAILAVRPRDDYLAWYPTFAEAGLVVPMWQPEHGGLGVGKDVARAIDAAEARVREAEPIARVIYLEPDLLR